MQLLGSVRTFSTLSIMLSSQKPAVSFALVNWRYNPRTGSYLDRPGLRRAEGSHEISVSRTLGIEGAFVEAVALCDLTHTVWGSMKELGWYT